MATRKIFNFESVILHDMTLEQEGYDHNIFGPGSNKFIWAVCRYCGQPSRIRKAFFNKSGSACHKECRFKEQKISPFADPNIREKARKTCLKKFGSEQASSNKEIAAKISKTKLTKESQNKTKVTNLALYGVENVFQLEAIKEKTINTMMTNYSVSNAMQCKEIKQKRKNTVIEKYGVDNVMDVQEFKNKQKKTLFDNYGVNTPLNHPEIARSRINTNLNKYGTEHPMQNKSIKEKTMLTCINKYGFKYPKQNPDIIKKSVNTFNNTVLKNPNDYYKIVNLLRSDSFWDDWKINEYTLTDLCIKHDIILGSLTNRLSSDEFREKYLSVYIKQKHQQQNQVNDFVKSLNFSTLTDTRKIIHPFELDIFVVERKFAIEFNGSYWHSEAVLEPKEAIWKHRVKTDLCRDQGIRLFHIFQNTWHDREKQIKSAIRTILNKNEIKLGARKCTISSDRVPEFIDENHIQGYDGRAMKFFNLIYRGELIASMTASLHHRANIKGSPIVLSRFCCKNNVSIAGGASKLFEAFKQWAKNEKFDRILSFSDSSWTEGSIYPILGFNFDYESRPDYFYWSSSNKKYISKQSQKKSNTGCPAEITERDWAYERGLYRIWDCGKKRWEFKL